MDRKISIAIPTYNRVEMTIESFYEVYDDERVSEIIIVDDASDMEVYEDLKSMCDALSKVKLYRNLTNQDCYRNKMTAISYATNEWCILLDSDNKIDISYIDRLYKLVNWIPEALYAPTFAKPTFDYRAYAGLIVDRYKVAEYIDRPMFETALNTSNFFVNRKKFLECWDGSVDPVTSDSIYFVYCWLTNGNWVHFIGGLEYEHKVWEGSHYVTQNHRTPQGFHESILQKLKELK